MGNEVIVGDLSIREIVAGEPMSYELAARSALDDAEAAR